MTDWHNLTLLEFIERFFPDEEIEITPTMRNLYERMKEQALAKEGKP